MLNPNNIDLVADNLSHTYVGCIGAIGSAEMCQAVAQKLRDMGISQPALWA
jgi:hypothetical protein